MLDLAAALKADRFVHPPLAGPRTVAILFDKPTLRTQLSFTVGIAELGGYPLVVDGQLAQIGVRESVADVARVLGPQVAAIVWRTFAQTSIEEMAAFAGVPVVNALTDDFHPCQILADLLTVREQFGRRPAARSPTSATARTTWRTPTCSAARPPACTSGSARPPATCRTPRSSPTPPRSPRPPAAPSRSCTTPPRP